MNKLQVKASEGMREILSIVKGKYVNDIAGLKGSRVSNGVTHVVQNGKPFYYTANDVERLQSAIITIGTDLLKTRVSWGSLTETESVCSYGENLAEQLRCLGKRLKLEPLIMGKLGMKEGVLRNYLVPSSRYYNKFPASMEDFPDQINDALKELALRMCSLELLLEEPGE